MKPVRPPAAQPAPSLPAGAVRPAPKNDACARAIARAWRELSGGRPTLVACSGGADSSALVLALAGAAKPGQLHVAHIVHDLRPRAHAMADRDAVHALAGALGLPLHVAQVRPRALGGNAEATARRLRYRALAKVARAQGCACIATGHHAHDQVETVLMALLRGAGARGLAGMAPARAVPGAPDLRLIRPCLGLERQQLQDLCGRCRWRWREDLTNADPSRLRGALRASVVPALLALRPAMVGGLHDRAALLRSSAGVVDRASARLLARCVLAKSPAEMVLDKRALVGRPLALVAGALRQALQGMGVTGQRLGHRQIVPLARAARARAQGQQWPKSFAISGVDARVSAQEVRLRARPESAVRRAKPR